MGPPGVEKSSYGRLGDLPLVFFLLKRLPTQLAPLATQLKPLRPKLMAPVTARPMLLNTPPLLLLPLRPLSLLLLLLLLLLLPVTHGGGGGHAEGKGAGRSPRVGRPTQPSAASPSHALCAGGGR